MEMNFPAPPKIQKFLIGDKMFGPKVTEIKFLGLLKILKNFYEEQKENLKLN